jgi:hypothetical protein
MAGPLDPTRPEPAAGGPAGTRGRAGGTLEILGVVAILGAFGAVALGVILLGAQLGYDESLYASKARSLVLEIPAPPWALYRPTGLPILGLAALPFGLGETSLRIVAAATGLLGLGLAWGLARLLWGGPAAAITLLALVASPVVLAQVTLFQNDLPAVAPLLALLALLWWQLELRDRPGLPLLAAGPLAAAAFYLRYGALAILLGVALAAALLWGRRALRDVRLVGATLVVAAAMFVPHVVEAIARTGSPLGIVAAAVTVADTTTPAEAALQYVRWLPRALAGFPGMALGIVAAVAAVHAAVSSARSRRATPAGRRLAWLLLPATVATLGTVVYAHPESRYLLTPLLLVEVAGAGGAAAAVAWLVPRLARASPRGARLVLPGLLAGLVVVAGVEGALWVRREVPAAREQWLADVGRAIGADAGPACAVVSTVGPVFGWYSGCEPLDFDDPSAAQARATAGTSVYVVFTTLDEGKNADPALLGRYRRELTLDEVVSTGTPSAGAVGYRVLP